MADENAETTEGTSTSEEKKPEFHFPFGTFRFWDPPLNLEDSEFFPETSYAASLMLIRAQRGENAEILLVKQNPNDPEKFTQRDGSIHKRNPGWKAPIGRFNPFRDPEKKLDQTLWDTIIQEFFEETGIDFEKMSESILKSLKQAPIFEYRVLSRRVGSLYHIDRVHFWITPQDFELNEEIWSGQQELMDVRWFELNELPKIGDNEASMLRSHAKRLVDFFECPQVSGNLGICWQSGIPDDIGNIIRNRFADMNYNL